MKTKDKAFSAFRDGRLSVTEFRRFVELRIILENDPNYKEFQQLTNKITRK